MEDRRHQIPLGCIVNVKIVDELATTDAFNKKCVEVPRDLGIGSPPGQERWPFFNFSWAAYMMYCLFVVHKEIYNLPADDEFYTDLVDNSAMDEFKIKKEKNSFDDDPEYHFRSFRNAVSHLNYTIDKNHRITLWDQYGEKAPRHWEVSISQDKMLDFLMAVGKQEIKLYDQIKRGKRNSDGRKSGS